jgi:hypothetical protein
MSKLVFAAPDQVPDPDWEEVRDLAEQAAIATMSGDMVKANDLYQYIAIEVMETLYGPNAVPAFIQYAMQNEEPEPEKSRIALL